MSDRGRRGRSPSTTATDGRIRWAALLATAALALLAGCGALGGPPSDAATPTVTPAPVPDPTPTPTERPGPASVPGLSATGVTDVGALTVAHVRALRNTTYERTLRRTVDGATAETVLRAAGPRRYRHAGETESGLFNVSTYADGETTYSRMGYGEPPAIRYDRSSAVRPPTDLFAGEVVGPLERFLSADDATVARTSSDEAPGYEVVADTPPASVEGVENFSFRATVSPAGVVRSLRVVYDRRTDDGRRRIVVEADYELRPVTVEPPEWVTRRAWTDATPTENGTAD